MTHVVNSSFYDITEVPLWVEPTEMPIFSQQHIQIMVVADDVPIYSSKGAGNVPYRLRPPLNYNLSHGMSIRMTGDSFLPLFRAVLVLFLSSVYGVKGLGTGSSQSLCIRIQWDNISFMTPFIMLTFNIVYLHPCVSRLSIIVTAYCSSFFDKVWYFFAFGRSMSASSLQFGWFVDLFGLRDMPACQQANPKRECSTYWVI